MKFSLSLLPLAWSISSVSADNRRIRNHISIGAVNGPNTRTIHREERRFFVEPMDQTELMNKLRFQNMNDDFFGGQKVSTNHNELHGNQITNKMCPMTS